jgi:hypothetical protein
MVAALLKRGRSGPHPIGSWLITACGLLLLQGGATEAAGEVVVVDFEQFDLQGATHANGSDGSGGFSTQEIRLNNRYDPQYGAWDAWALSRETDVATPGYQNQYSVFSSSGAGGSATFAVAYSGADAGGGEVPRIELPVGAEPVSLEVNNTTYAALVMRDGDTHGFSKKFGGDTGSDPDWFRVTIEGVDQHAVTVGSVSHLLADYRFADNALDYVQADWVLIDLASLQGLGVRELHVRLDSTDVAVGQVPGVLTPTYVAVDRLIYSRPVLESADFDLDQVVGVADLARWEEHFGTRGPATELFPLGDANRNSAVDGADLLVWQRQFSSSASPVVEFAAVRIPEPHPLPCLAAALLWIAIGKPIRTHHPDERPSTPR